MSYKDIIPKLGLPEDLNKRLEELLTIEKDKERRGEGTFHPGFKELNEARKQFRHAYRKLRKQSPSKMGNKENNCELDDDLNLSMSSSDSEDSDLVEITDPKDEMMKRLPGVLTEEQRKGLLKENGQLKYLEDKYLAKKTQLEQALKELEDDDKVDEDLLRSVTKELEVDLEGYDYEAENEELDRIINELKEMTKEIPAGSGKIEEITD